MHVYGELTGILNAGATISGALSSPATLEGELTIPSAAGIVSYDGDYEWTPTEQTQTIEIEGLRATENITINPIPSNYGLITYNGTTITVS